MIQRRNGIGFTLESLTELLLETFSATNAIQSRIAGLGDVAHAGRIDRREDLVRPELVTTEAAYE